jgi:hypothetical protein
LYWSRNLENSEGLKSKAPVALHLGFEVLRSRRRIPLEGQDIVADPEPESLPLVAPGRKAVLDSFMSW